MMVDGKKLEKPKEGLDTGLKMASFTNLAEHDVVSGKDGSASDSTSSIFSSGDANCSMKGGTDQETAEQGVCYPPNSLYCYYYPGYDGAYPEWNNHGYFYAGGDGSEIPYSGIQVDNGSLVYYMPGFNPYTAGTLMGVDGQCVGQQPYFPSSGFLQPTISYSSSWNSTPVGDAAMGTAAVPADAKPSASDAAVKSKGLDSVKTKVNVDTKVSELPVGSKSCASTASSNFSKSSLQTQPFKPFVNKVPHLVSDFRSSGLFKGYYPMGKYSSFANQGHGLFPDSDHMSYRPNAQTWAGNYRFKLREKFNRNAEFEASSELNRGPRAHGGSATLSSSDEKDQLGPTVRRDQYNLQDFQIKYENAKFYIIKSYSEDNIHRSIKYDVWSSTPNGNRKLDAAFCDSETRYGETGTRCPIFLFFSVNGSGQFVGLAEMIGPVDFKKDMDFWHHDKWNGFFPVQWHIIKDIPSGQLRHIVLENNDNKPVTNSRDTQEIGFKQGSEMLSIFKNYLAKTSMLDDFKFYENREKLLIARSCKTASPQLETSMNDEFAEHLEARVRRGEGKSLRAKKTYDPQTSLVALAKNLSLKSTG